MIGRTAAFALAFWLGFSNNGWTDQGSESLKVPTFGTVTVYAPEGNPKQVVLFISGDGGWNLGVVPMAERLRSLGALVVGIDIRSFMKRLEASTSCAFPAGDLEELSRAVQQRFKLPTYTPPILVGYSSGATLVYAAIAAAPPEAFAGAVSLGFCPDLEISVPLCHMRGLKTVKRTRGIGYDLAPFAASTVPWMVLQGEIDQVCSPATTRTFVASTGATRLFTLPKVGHGFAVPANWEPQYIEAYQAIANAVAPREVGRATAPAVAELSLVEVPAAGTEIGDTWAIMLSGDGGWAEIDKSVAAAMSVRGIPVVGWSSLDYFWKPRTPEGASADLARIIDHYSLVWKRKRVLLVGYSFGADVTPFLVNRLPDSTRARVAGVTLLGPSDTAAFEFHFSSWLGGGGSEQYRTLPEIERMTVPVTCISGVDEADSICRSVRGLHVRAATVGEGHHFSGAYSRLVDLMVRE